MKRLSTLCLLPMIGAVALLHFTPACDSYECTELACSDLAGVPSLPGTFTMCERSDGYIRLDDEEGEEAYECFCDAAFMKDAARKLCTEGAVCRKSGSVCNNSGDCCAGLPCTFNICG